MKMWSIASVLLLWTDAVVGQEAGHDVSKTVLYEEAYNAVIPDLPSGPHVVVANDPLLRGSADRREDIRQGNEGFAVANGLTSAELSDVLTCNTSVDCRFVNDDVVATVSFRLASQQADSIVVEVATRHFIESPRHPLKWQTLALYEVRFARKNGEWEVVNVTPRGHS